MPVVPYQTGRIENTPVPFADSGRQATAESFGGAQAGQLADAGQALKQSGSAIGNVGLDEQDKVNKSLVRDALNQYRFKAADYASNSVYTKKGRETFGIEQSADKDLSMMADELSGGLQNDEQKKIFASEAAGIKYGHLNDFQRYAVGQREQFDQDTLSGENLGFQQDAVAHRYDPGIINHAEENIVNNIGHLYHGRSKTLVDQEVAKSVDALHSDILDSIGHDSPLKALAYLKANETKFLPDRVDNLKNKWMDAGRSEVAHNQAEIASGLYNNPVDAQGYVDKLQVDGETKDLIMSNFKTRLKDKQNAQNQAQWDLTEKRWGEFLNNPNTPTPNDIPTSEQLKMNTTRQEIIDRAGRPAPSDPATVADLIDKTTTGQIVNENIYALRGKLNEKDFNDFLNTQKGLRSGDGKPAERIGTIKEQADQVVDGMAAFGTAKTRQDDAALNTRYQNFMAALNTRVNALPKDKQDNQATLNIINDMLKPSITESHWFGADSVVKYKFETGKEAAPDLKSVPQTIKGLPGVQYNPKTQEYRVPVQNGFDVYDTKGANIRHDAAGAKAMNPTSTGQPQAWNFAPSVNPITDPDQLSRGLKGGLKPYASAFVEAGLKYKVDPALLAAISSFETGYGTSKAFLQGQNAMGVSDNAGAISFVNAGGVQASIERMAKKIGTDPIYDSARRQGTIEALARIYSPPGASNDPNGTNGEWPQSVKRLYNDLKSS